MTVRTAEQAATRAQASSINRPGTCQLWTRELFNAPSVGDVDHDGDADAVDGWKREPAQAKFTNRNPPRGAPVAWSGGSHGYGHRAISLGDGMIRSIDVGGPGRVGTVHLGWFEKNWGLHYLGWSATISRLLIPGLRLPRVEVQIDEETIEVTPKPGPKLKSLGVVANEVIKGKWGNGIEREAKLSAAGYNPKAVQAKVNALLK